MRCVGKGNDPPVLTIRFVSCSYTDVYLWLACSGDLLFRLQKNSFPTLLAMK